MSVKECPAKWDIKCELCHYQKEGLCDYPYLGADKLPLIGETRRVRERTRHWRYEVFASCAQCGKEKKVKVSTYNKDMKLYPRKRWYCNRICMSLKKWNTQPDE